MKAFHLKPVRNFSSPYSKELEEMLSVTRERSVTFHSGVRGVILGKQVVAPFIQNESCVVEKDGHKVVLSFVNTDKWGVSHFLLPFDIVCEPLHFRHEPIRRDTYLFRVFDQIHLAHAFPVSSGGGDYGMDSLDQFCPVFDRHGHLIGINTGVFKDHLVCVKVEALL